LEAVKSTVAVPFYFVTNSLLTGIITFLNFNALSLLLSKLNVFSLSVFFNLDVVSIGL